MKTGTIFHNSGMTLTCLAFHGDERRNVGLFCRDGDGMYITARDTSKDKTGEYSWAWGHYFTDEKAAWKDYKSRVAGLN